MKIRDIVLLKEFDPVIDLTRAENLNEQERLLGNYIMTEKLAETFINILESINMTRSSNRREEKGGDIDRIATKRSHIVTGQYGMGKSYFLLMLNIILEMKNTKLYDELIKRFQRFPELKYHLEFIKNNKKYFVVRINGEAENEKDFKDMLQEEIIKSLQNNFGEIEITSVYQEALDGLDRLYLNMSNQIDKFLDNLNLDIDDLKAGLSNYQREYLDIFKKLSIDLIGNEIKLSIKNMEVFLRDVNKELEKHGYNELVIILDEFSAYLTSSIESNRISTDLGNIQSLCQLTPVNSGVNVSFVTSTHKDLGQMLDGNDGTSKDQLDKVFGRFQQHILAFDQGEELLKNTIDLDVQKFNKYSMTYRDYIVRLENIYNTSFLDFYPLHPATVKFLEPISQLYAQKVRTTFSFLKEVVKEKFFNKNIEDNGKLNLITLSEIFDYFETSIESKDNNIIRVYNQTANESIIEKDEDLKDFLKALTVAYVSSASKAGKTELSAEELRDIYQIDSEETVKTKMIPVISNDYLNITTIDGKYRLFVNNSGINLDKVIATEKEKINPYKMLRSILSKSENRVFIKNNYNLKYSMGIYPFDRKLEGEILDLSELESKDKNKLFKTAEDGKIVFLIPDFSENFNMESIEKKYGEILRNYNKNICLAIPKDIMFTIDDLKTYGAIKKIEKNNEDIIKNEELKKILFRRKRKLEDKIRNKYLRRFANLRNYSFIFGGGEIKDNLKQEIMLYKELLYNYYEKFPYEIKVENFNNRGPLNKLVEKFIENGIGKLARDDNAEQVKQIYATLLPLDLGFQKENHGPKIIELKSPEEKNSKKSYEIMKHIETEHESLKETFNILKRAPYGLNDPLILLYFYVANKIGRITVIEKEKKKYISLDVTSLKNILEKPEDFKIEKNDIETVPEEVGIVWKILGRICVASSCKKFRNDGRAEINIYVSIKRELDGLLKTLRDRDLRLTKKEIKISKLKNLISRLDQLEKNKDKKRYYDMVMDIPTIFKKSTYEENLEELDKLIKGLKNLEANEITTYETFCDTLWKLRPLIVELNGYSDLKEQLRELELLNEDYKNDCFNIDLLDSMAEKAKGLLQTYNHEFKINHDKYHDKFKRLKDKLFSEEETKIECLKNLSKLNFIEIASLEEFFDEMNNYDKCEIFIEDGKIASCKQCDCDEIKKVENSISELDEKFNGYHRRIIGVYERYLEALEDPVIKEKLNKNDDYINLRIILNNINNNIIKPEYISLVSNKIEALENVINNQILNNEINKENVIPMEEIKNKILQEIQSLGKQYISLDEFKEKFDKVITECKQQNYIQTKI